MIDFILISMAIASITITISKTLIFKSLRDNLPGKWLKKLISCPYCLSHYLSFLAAFFIASNCFDLIVKTMALVTLSSIFAVPILLYLRILDTNE